MVRPLISPGAPYAQARTALQQYRSLISLMTTANTIANDAPSLDAALQQAVDAIAWHTGWPVCHVYLRADRPADELAPSPIWHLATPERHERFRWTTEATRFRPGLGLVGHVQATGQPVWAADVTADHRFIRRRDGSDLGVRAGILCPILIGRDVAGVLECFSPRIIDPDPSLLDILANVGMILGRAIERTRQPRHPMEPLDIVSATRLQRVRHEAAAALVSSIAHEVNNPLYAARSALELLAAEPAPAAGPLATIAADELARIAAVMDQLGGFAPVPPLQREAVDLRVLIEAAVSEAGIHARRPAIEVRLTIAKVRQPAQLVCDRTLLQQALTEVLVNGADAMPDGGWLAVHGCADHERTVITITDSGAGLEIGTLPHLFEPFFTTKPGHSGLGLARCATIIAQHGGEITIDSATRQGTICRITIPQAGRPAR